MASLPDYVIVRPTGYSETFQPSVIRTEMERGMPKQRLLNTQVLYNLNLSLITETQQQTEDFMDWYFLTIKRIDFFTMTHPRTGQLINVRFVGGDFGTLQTISGANRIWQRDVVVEYLR